MMLGLPQFQGDMHEGGYALDTNIYHNNTQFTYWEYCKFLIRQRQQPNSIYYEAKSNILDLVALHQPHT